MVQADRLSNPETSCSAPCSWIARSLGATGSELALLKFGRNAHCLQMDRHGVCNIASVTTRHRQRHRYVGAAASREDHSVALRQTRFANSESVQPIIGVWHGSGPLDFPSRALLRRPF